MSQTSDTPMTPQERAINAALFYDKWLNDSSLETWFPITFEEICRIKIQMNELVKYVRHQSSCTNNPCTCGLSKLLEEIKA